MVERQRGDIQDTQFLSYRYKLDDDLEEDIHILSQGKSLLGVLVSSFISEGQ